jgi:DNA ligase-1
LWHGLQPPYESLFAWLEGKGGKPALATPAIFHSVMLANPVGEGDLAGLDPVDYAAEWKWDGIRVQLSRAGDVSKLYSRSGDDISAAFPDIVDAISFDGVWTASCWSAAPPAPTARPAPSPTCSSASTARP